MFVAVSSTVLGIIRQFLMDSRGSVLPLLAAVVLISVAGGAIAVDLTRAYAYRGQLQITADAAALAAAVNLPDLEAARLSAYRYAKKNMPDFDDVVSADDVEFGHWDPDTRTMSPDMHSPSALRITARLGQKNGNSVGTLFSGIFGQELIDVSASAVAGKRSAMCILALEADQADALGMDIAAEIEAKNCTVQVNSRHKWAFRIWLGSKFSASGLCVTGGAYLSLFARVEPEPTLGCPPQLDPLAELKAPVVGGCDHHESVFMGHHGTLQPGVYCGGLQIMGASNVSLAAGTYIIKDGPLSVFDSSKVNGENITFFLTGDDAVIRFEDNSALTLSAPTTGDMAGILVFQDRDYAGYHLWDSDAPTELHGTIYMPEGHLLSQSSNAITPVNSCNVLIAKSLRFKFRSGVSIDLGRTECQQYLPAAVLGTVALLD